MVYQITVGNKKYGTYNSYYEAIRVKNSLMHKGLADVKFTITGSDLVKNTGPSSKVNKNSKVSEWLKMVDKIENFRYKGKERE